MTVFEKRSRIPVSADALYTFHARPGAFERLSPPWEHIETVRAEGGIENDAIREMRISQGPLSLRWLARHRGHVAGARFVDEMEVGPFKRWVHEHLFLPDGNDSILQDCVDWDLPLTPLSKPAEPLVERKLERMFAFRHRRTAHDLIRHQRYFDVPKRIVFVGQMTRTARDLAAFLSTGGNEVYVMRPEREGGDKWRFVFHPFGEQRLCHPLDGADAVINTLRPFKQLAGEEEPFAHLDYLYRTVPLLSEEPHFLINLHEDNPSLEHYTTDLALDPTDKSPKNRRLRELAHLEQLLELLDDAFPRRLNLYLGCVIRAPYAHMVNLLLHLETYLFLADGAKTPHFGWISADDVCGAVLHVLHQGSLEGNIALIHPQSATRAELQRLLLQRHFLAYTWHRLLRVLPWSMPGLPGGMKPELLSMRPITDTGFQPMANDLGQAVRHELGEI